MNPEDSATKDAGRGRDHEAMLTRVDEAVESAATSGKVALGVLAASIYGVVRIAYDSFYGRFGMSPEDVGHNYASILARAALGGTYATLVAVIAVTVVYALLQALGRWRSRTGSTGEDLVLSVLMVVCGAVALFSMWAKDFFDDHLLNFLLVLAIPVLAVCVAYPGYRRHQLRLAVNVPVLIMFAGIAIALTSQWGDFEARRVAEGEELRRGGVFRVLDIRAEHVTLHWLDTGSSSAAGLQGDATFLGEANGTTVLLVDGPAETLDVYRVPSSKVALRHR